MAKENITVIIVEDDITTRKYFKENIDWAGGGYTLIGLADDGIAGLELIEETDPDIVITDIQMPCMDGLTMLKELKVKGIHPRIIILSAHDEFEYAKAAINLSVDAYINKPVDEAALFEVLDQSKYKLENERRISSQAKDSLPLLRQSFLSQLLLGYYRDANVIKERADYLEISLGEGPFLCVAARFDPSSPEVKKRDAQGREFLKTSIFNIIKNAMEGICQVYFCDTGDTSFALLFTLTKKNTAEAALARELEGVIHISRNRTKVPLTLALSNLHNKTVSIAAGYQEALKALSCDHVLGTDRIISIQDINMEKNKQSWEMQNVVNELSRAIRVADNNLAD
ncbi:MAG: response regulator, partial [Treponema sp.]|nr:response regulator [Treponema sp.]